jgi:ArsR family transcriptional regulator
MRIRLLERLRAGEASVQELTLLTGASQQNVSKHLSVLLQANVVTRRKQGNFAFYAIADESVLELCESVCRSLERRLESLRAVVVGARA